ncbi:hypothetical protein UFOVP20_14 [uncultured Caudovirales phage]|uniref:Uncharacterized protein n=1 Tax=uncultured Caudovirales phage TaxID=2100421 RepID=A0A6J5KIA7_9CAUD|nr:hypothetical protein UFOVP20_14 [uncultured Caudovirales phage]
MNIFIGFAVILTGVSLLIAVIAAIVWVAIWTTK